MITKPDETKKILDIKTELNIFINILKEEKTYFLKTYISNKFLINLLDELAFVVKYRDIQLGIISHLYDLFELEMNLQSKKKKTSNGEKLGIEAIEEQKEDEKPINVFHANGNNKENFVKSVGTNKKSRVEIIRASKDLSEKKNIQENSNKEIKSTRLCKKDLKIFLKRLEFYFKWLNQADNAVLISCTSLRNIADDILSLKDSLSSDNEVFEKEKEFIDKNLNTIRKNQYESNRNKEELITEI